MNARTENVVAKSSSYYSGRYTNPVIPDGYRYAYGTWSDGFVIERIKDGSCFTFVPVGFLSNNATLDGKRFNEKFGRRKWYEKETNELGEEPIKRILWNQLQSVREYGGFYVSTYRISKSKFSKPQSLEEGKPWNYIDFNCAMEIAQSFEFSSKLESHLVFGAEYDSILEWFIETNAESFEDVTSLKKDISAQNMRENLMTNNVFDLSGSSYEWTQEMAKSKGMKAIIRGGTRIETGKTRPVAYRSGCSTFIKRPYIGFRIALSIP